MLKEKRALVAAILLAWLPLVIGVAYPAVWNWSTTASSNASADPTINWREGQSPSSINDSARSMMAALAGYRDDISGALATTGTSTAYLVTTNQGLPNPPSDGQLLAITVNNTNGISPTLSADGGGTFAIQSSAGTAVPAGTMISGSPYSLKFSISNNAWLLRDFYPSPLTTPLGGLVPYTGITAPNSNYILPAGQCISTTTYATYWVLLGSPASGSCAGGQFQVIDLRGRTLAALDNLNGTAANRMTAAGCGAALTSVGTACTTTETFQLLTTNLPPYTPSGSLSVTSSVSNVLQGTPASVSLQGGAVPSVILNAGASSSSVTSTGTLTGSPQGGSSTAIPRVQPTIGVTYLLRVI